ncbi:MAG: hypothetical protein HY785_14545 [Oscillatoriophycideae cyanobacterium NC_groundwater_1537_Pr4_S-0.65um_50_18]|nr:hypothetical protein [Oscillatoriophycideae cyanobacterium NC_groundwater_1537_Pr4_S-0.65um_50_18]
MSVAVGFVTGLYLPLAVFATGLYLPLGCICDNVCMCDGEWSDRQPAKLTAGYSDILIQPRIVLIFIPALGSALPLWFCFPSAVR